jgi:hypothetical protein
MSPESLRQSPRIDYAVPVELRGVAPGAASDAPSQVLAVGDTVACSFVLQGERALLQGRVAWSDRAQTSALDRQAGMGIHFEDLPSRESSVLRHMVAAAKGSGDTVWLKFDGLQDFIRTRASITPTGVKLSAALPILRPNTRVDLMLSDGAPTLAGSVGRVQLVDRDGTPHLEVEIETPEPKRMRKHAMFAPLAAQGSAKVGTAVRSRKATVLHWRASKPVSAANDIATTARPSDRPQIVERSRPTTDHVATATMHRQRVIIALVLATGLGALSAAATRRIHPPRARTATPHVNASPKPAPSAPEAPHVTAALTVPAPLQSTASETPTPVPVSVAPPSTPVEISVSNHVTTIWVPAIANKDDVRFNLWASPNAVDLQMVNVRASLPMGRQKLSAGIVSSINVAPIGADGVRVQAMLIAPVKRHHLQYETDGIRIRLEQ